MGGSQPLPPGLIGDSSHVGGDRSGGLLSVRPCSPQLVCSLTQFSKQLSITSFLERRHREASKSPKNTQLMVAGRQAPKPYPPRQVRRDWLHRGGGGLTAGKQ